MQKRNLWIVFIIPIVILTTGFSFYYFNFHKGNLSSSSQDWGSYGSYVTSFVNLSNLCVVIYFSYLVYQYNSRKDKDAKERESEFRKFQQVLQNPVLTFKTSSINGKEIWQIINVGNGAALNLQVSYKSNRSGNWIEPLVKCYSLGKSDTIDLDWFTHRPDVIGVHYKDIFENQFVTIVGNDISEVRPFMENFPAIEINDFKYTKSYFDDMLAIPSKRLSWVRNQNPNTTTSGTTTTETTA
jgi:hypothetical protein